jgi:hypothetical protein
MEKLRQGPMFHLGVKGVDDDDNDGDDVNDCRLRGNTFCRELIPL